ncbi:MAG: phosphoglycerate dehydrogenase [Pseudomonadota bacterium]
MDIQQTPDRHRTVVVSQRFFDADAIALLEAHGCRVKLADLPPGQADGALSEAALHALLADADAWIVGHASVSRTLLAGLPRLRVVARRGVGYERVDMDALRDLGKVGTVAVGGNDACVADHTLGMMLALGHRLRESQRQMEGGDWAILPGRDLYRKTVGIVGLGRIGRGVVQRLLGFEATILVATPRRACGPLNPAGGANRLSYVGLETLLEQSDYVSLHAPLTTETRRMIDANALARMKPGAFLVNTSRGGLVDDAALLQALESGHLGGAGLDVFESETDPALLGVTKKLLGLPNVVATPHAGASTREGLERTNMLAARCVVGVLDGTALPPDCLIADGRTAKREHAC